ncbi:FAD/NAD(P)-binding oxidoreductase [Phytohabitans sp. ZYX-F-186]|uniref:FAD/NAD(P)-binding oxidoreductase n=1 Tax=Phytohabitans maris TaxID=3071409 RepID=A0ABU0ZK75_9ACTN|nr:FAD/NAD(P)-binding oxidoreductase [Phytohabitans sp. ZYX-F-186]MDQ7907455.1 FAD/NAD(P)-binding oxidoreductase [Phytohabitans sp. ZYX-F-186]
MADPRHVLVVGGSAAGLSTAEALRRFGFDGALTVLEAEPGPPYDRPPLSKQVLDGSWAPERAALFPAGRLARIGFRHLTGVRAVALDRRRRVVRTDVAGDITYDELVIATGAAPRRLAGDRLPGVHVLRTMTDALRLRDDLLGGGRLLVVGAGFVGLEVAASARRLGVPVTVVDPDPCALAGRLGSAVAGRLLALHAGHGVDLRLGAGVRRITRSGGRPDGLDLTDGTHLEGAAVLVAIGCRPVVDWVAGNGLDAGDGVGCDPRCQAAPGIWAVGDVARWHHDGFGRSMRIEHRQHATEQAQAVARNILGAGLAFTPTPYFWTDHFDVRVQVAGFVPAGATLRPVEGDIVQGRFVARAEHGGRVTGVVAWNSAKAFTAHRRLVPAFAGAARRPTSGNEEQS